MYEGSALWFVIFTSPSTLKEKRTTHISLVPLGQWWRESGGERPYQIISVRY